MLLLLVIKFSIPPRMRLDGEVETDTLSLDATLALAFGGVTGVLLLLMVAETLAVLVVVVVVVVDVAMRAAELLCRTGS